MPMPGLQFILATLLALVAHDPVDALMARGEVVHLAALTPHAVVAIYADGSAAAVEVEAAPDTGKWQYSYADDDSDTQDPLPGFRTTWTDKKGVSHEVYTPIVGTTEAARRRAFETHKGLVDLMQGEFPPKPVPDN